MEYNDNLRIDYPISMLCTVEYPSFCPLNKDWVDARGSAFSETQKVFIQIDENGWQEANGTVNWLYRFNTKELAEGRHAFCIQLFDGKSRSGIYEKHLSLEIANVGLTSKVSKQRLCMLMSMVGSKMEDSLVVHPPLFQLKVCIWV